MQKTLHKHDIFIDRELSWLEFNRRVLAQVSDECIPLLERLRFLFICSANLDEFFEIRVAGLKHHIGTGTKNEKPDRLNLSDELKQIHQCTAEIVQEQYRVFNEILLPKLAKEHIYFLKPTEWDKAQTAWLKRYFNTVVMPVLSPVGLDLARPFPRLVNKRLNFVVSLQGTDAFKRNSGLAIVHVPRTLARAIKLPQTQTKTKCCLVFLASLIETYISKLFPGMKVTGCYQFRLTRDSDLWLDEDVQDLAGSLKNKLRTRGYGNAVRLEIAAHCPTEITNFLLKQHGLTDIELYTIPGPINLSRFADALKLIDRPKLRYPNFVPGIPKRLDNAKNIFASIQRQDILIHHPYQSFDVILDFVREAATDPKVIAIKQTLYRTGANSQIVKALVDAARANKEVIAVIELRARFDEESNIELANILQEAGALVVYGAMNYKTHAKMCLVVREENRKLRYYSHLGTGNYHAGTAKEYTDISLLTYDQKIGQDVQQLFQQLIGMGKQTKLRHLWQAPFNLHKHLHKLILKEMGFAKAGKPAHIIAKMNALTEPKIIEVLYKASKAGVKIDLIVRGICCLRPGIPGLSDNITVHSIVGRFLEHSRIYYFYQDGAEKLYCSSADWMERNFFHRIEVCFPILDKKLAQQLKKQVLITYLADNRDSWLLNADGSYTHVQPNTEKVQAAQDELLNLLAKKA